MEITLKIIGVVKNHKHDHSGRLIVTPRGYSGKYNLVIGSLA